MAGRPKIYNEHEAIDKAIDVFWKKGYELASAEELLEAMGIGKGSFYLAFKGGKKELFERAMERRSDLGVEGWRKGIEEASSKLDYLKSKFLNVLDRKSKRPDNGCMLGNTIAELSNSKPELRQQASELLLRLERIFQYVIEEAQLSGEIDATNDPALLARQLLLFWNGLNISVRIYPDPQVLRPLIEAQFKTLT
jgi:TetR/AcrR family transcriptional regulator, transcriptional repressor for nem operon